MTREAYFPVRIAIKEKTLLAWGSEQPPAAVALRAANLLARSIPTPYAQAEMMARVLREVPEDPNAPPPSHEPTELMPQTWDRWRWLLLAVVQGILRVENVPLVSVQADNFGLMLVQARSEQRHIARLVRTEVLGPGGRSTFGASDPECLVWASPRVERTKEWSTLQNAVEHPEGGGVSVTDALALLAEWRLVLQNAQLWPSKDPHAPGWMRAIDYLLAHEKVPVPIATSLLDDHCELVGPVMLSMSSAARLCVYLPTLRRGHQERMRKLLGLRPVAPQGSTGAVSAFVALEIPDGSKGDPVAKVRMSVGAAEPGAGAPAAETTPQHALLEGLGEVVPPLRGDMPWFERVTTGQWLHDTAGRGGYDSRVLQHLRAAVIQAHESNPARPASLRFDASTVDLVPVLFPDAVRIPARLLAPRQGNVPTHVLDADAARKRGAMIPADAPRLAQAHAAANPPEGAPEFVLALPGPPPALALAEWLTRADGTRVDVGHFRALGFVLWCFFLGSAQARDGAVDWSGAPRGVGRRLLTLGSDDGTSPQMGEVLFTAVESALADGKTLGGWSLQEDAWRRRAALQRFWSTARGWQDGNNAGAWLAALAARCFVAWVRGGRPLGEFGMPGAPVSEARELKLVAGLALPLARDPYCLMR